MELGSGNIGFLRVPKNQNNHFIAFFETWLKSENGLWFLKNCLVKTGKIFMFRLMTPFTQQSFCNPIFFVLISNSTVGKGFLLEGAEEIFC